jgi:ketosteroid isomerase-like protein
MEADFQRYSAEVFVELNRELQAWGAAWMRGGSAELGRFYMEDATLTLVDGTRVSGREEITRRLRAFAPASGSFHSGVYDFALGGTLAYTRGWFQVDGATPAHGEIVTVFRERSGRWQILYQTFVDRE